jgi:hypothetical protein
MACGCNTADTSTPVNEWGHIWVFCLLTSKSFPVCQCGALFKVMWHCLEHVWIMNKWWTRKQINSRAVWAEGLTRLWSLLATTVCEFWFFSASALFIWLCNCTVSSFCEFAFRWSNWILPVISEKTYIFMMVSLRKLTKYWMQNGEMIKLNMVRCGKKSFHLVFEILWIKCLEGLKKINNNNNNNKPCFTQRTFLL